MIIFFASCRPDGRALYNNTVKGTPTKSDTVLHHKFEGNKGDTVKWEEPNVPQRLRR